MDKKKLIAMLLGLALAIAGTVTGYNWKQAVCESEQSEQAK